MSILIETRSVWFFRYLDERPSKPRQRRTDRIFFCQFAHGRTVEIGYFNDRTKERVRNN
jgi:hypothetical protein